MNTCFWEKEHNG
jgi:hypothetical protein